MKFLIDSKVHLYILREAVKNTLRGGSLKFAAEGRETRTPLKILYRTCTPPKTDSNSQDPP